jgi:hypothetical protein
VSARTVTGADRCLQPDSGMTPDLSLSDDGEHMISLTKIPNEHHAAFLVNILLPHTNIAHGKVVQRVGLKLGDVLSMFSSVLHSLQLDFGLSNNDTQNCDFTNLKFIK